MKLPFEIDLKGKTAVITGAGGVLCSHFAKVLAACGANIAVLSLKQNNADKVVDEIKDSGGNAIGIAVDVLKKDTLLIARESINKEYGRCDILINGAGGNTPEGTTTKEFFYKEDLENIEIVTFFDLDMKGIEYVFDLNTLGLIMSTQVFSRDMVGIDDAVIINVSSASAYSPLTKVPAYSGAKAAVSNFTQWLAVHLSKDGIRVNAIAPGFFQTKQNNDLLFNADCSFTERSKKILNLTPMGRFGSVEDLTGTLLWLVCKEASGFVNGAIIPVDGGFSIYKGI